MAKKEPKETLPNSTAFTQLVELMAQFSQAHNQLAWMENLANEELLQILDNRRQEYAQLQEALKTAEQAMEAIALAHPEWFASKKSIKMPYGTVKLTKSTKLDVPNEEATVLLIQRESERNPDFKLETYLRQVETLNLEALEALEDSTLRKLRVNRVTTENFSVSPAKVEMGKAVKAALDPVPA